MSNIERRVLGILEQGLPLTMYPLKDIAARLNIKPGEVIKIIKSLIRKKVIRRFGVTLSHRKAGFVFNAMAVWNVAADRVDEVGRLMSRSDRISHCYERKTNCIWKYNLYTMIHGKNRQDCQRLAEGIAKASGIYDYRLLYTKDEFKKSAMKYF